MSSRLPAGPGHAGAKPLSAGVLGVVEHVRRGAAFDHCPAVQHDRFVGELAHNGQIVADQDVGDMGFVADVGEQVEHLSLDRHVQRRDRFVEDQHAGLGREGTRDRDALALAAGQGAGQGPGLPRVQADQPGELGDPGAAAVDGSC